MPGDVPAFRHMGDLHSPPPVIDPVCAFHGKKWSEHEGGRCLYCCICYKPLTPDECVVNTAGEKWDVCKGRCAVEAGIEEASDDPVHTTNR